MNHALPLEAWGRRLMTRAEAWNSSARARKYREEPDEDVASRNQAARTW